MNIKNFSKVTVILRGYDESQVEFILNALSETTLNSVEITLNTPNAFSMIKKMKNIFSTSLNIGAGTVLSLDDAEKAIDAGAEFLLSPVVMEKEIIEYAKKYQVVTVPGAFTPTEISRSVQDGADIVKIFPATSLPICFVSDITAPLGRIPLMAVGGINSENAHGFLENGFSYLGIGSGIFKKSDVLEKNYESLLESIHAFEKKI